MPGARAHQSIGFGHAMRGAPSADTFPQITGPLGDGIDARILGPEGHTAINIRQRPVARLA